MSSLCVSGQNTQHFIGLLLILSMNLSEYTVCMTVSYSDYCLNRDKLELASMYMWSVSQNTRTTKPDVNCFLPASCSAPYNLSGFCSCASLWSYSVPSLLASHSFDCMETTRAVNLHTVAACSCSVSVRPPLN